jgi:hypothetical protein
MIENPRLFRYEKDEVSFMLTNCNSWVTANHKKIIFSQQAQSHSLAHLHQTNQSEATVSVFQDWLAIHSMSKPSPLPPLRKDSISFIAKGEYLSRTPSDTYSFPLDVRYFLVRWLHLRMNIWFTETSFSTPRALAITGSKVPPKHIHR